MKCVSCSLLFVQKSKFYKMYWSNFANNISVDGIVTKVADEPTTESEDEDKDEDEDEDEDEGEDEDEDDDVVLGSQQWEYFPFLRASRFSKEWTIHK